MSDHPNHGSNVHTHTASIHRGSAVIYPRNTVISGDNSDLLDLLWPGFSPPPHRLGQASG
eukprot:3631485-Rhodomonas_salina.1